MDNKMSCDNVGMSASNHALTIDDNVVTKKPKVRHIHRRSRLTGIIVCLVIISIIFVTLFAIFYSKYIDCTDESPITECTTPDCVHTASLMLHKMDREADPCQDFSQFACGGFYKNTIMPDDQSYVDTSTYIGGKNGETIRLILQAGIRPQEKPSYYVTKMKQFYRMCLDTDRIETIGLRPYLASDDVKDWPTLNPDWNSTTFDLNDVMVKYEGLMTGKDNLFNYLIGPDLLQSTKNVIKISEPSLCLDPAVVRNSLRNESAILACQNYYVDIATALGADNATALEDAKQLMDFENKLALASKTKVEKANKTLLYNPMTLQEMSKNFPPIDWHRIFQAIFQTAGMSLEGNTTIINESPEYFESLRDILKSTSNRVVQNLYSFSRAVALLNNLTPAMRDATLELKKHTEGITQLSPRWKQCVQEVTEVFRAGLAKQYVSRTFSQRSKTYIIRMLKNLKASFHQQLDNASWLGQQTKQAAFKKLDSLAHRIGYPDSHFDDVYIDNMYSNTTITKDRFYQTRLDLLRHNNIAKLHEITRKAGNNWQGNSMAINVQNVFQANEIRFYAGFIQPTFFSEAYPSSINYGGIGSVIGHELTHFFDNEGRQYDEHGNLRNWWQPRDLKEFNKRIQCLVDQYSGFQIKEISTNLNGKLVIGETTADNGGIKASFKAYKEFSRTSERELPLPGLNLNLQQQFFLAFAQTHCSIHTKNDLKNMVNIKHPLGKYRILGTLQNSVEFSETFNCPVGSAMNPAKKCSVW